MPSLLPTRFLTAAGPMLATGFPVTAQAATSGAPGISLFSLLMIAGFGAIIIANVWRHLKVKAMRQQNYEWYRQTFPACRTRRGGLSCNICGGDRIHTQRLMKQTWLRAHFCAQCGQTLYYSPER